MKKLILGSALALWAVVPSIAQAQKAKPVVAVVRIDDLAHTGQAATLSSMIESAVAGSGRFRLMEREQMGKLVGEQTRARGGVVTTNSPGRAGGFEGVDYLIYGTITALGSKSGADAGSNLLHGFLGDKNAGCTATVATLALDIKITDAATSEIKYVSRINEQQKNSACGGRAEIDGAALMRSAAQKIAIGLVTSIYPIQVAAVQGDGTIVLNYGEGAVSPGQVLSVVARGKEIRDPATGEVLGADETRLGYVRVVSVTGRVSRAVPLGALVTQIPVGAFVHNVSDAEARAAAKPVKSR